MPIVNYTEKVIELQDAEIKKIEKSEEKTIIYLEIKRKDNVCPVCGKKTNRLFSAKFTLWASEIASLRNICLVNVEYSPARMWANFISHCDAGAIFRNFSKEIVSRSP